MMEDLAKLTKEEEEILMLTEEIRNGRRVLGKDRIKGILDTLL